MKKQMIKNIKLVLDTCIEKANRENNNGLLDSNTTKYQDNSALTKAIKDIYNFIIDNNYGRSVSYSEYFDAEWKLIFYRGRCFAARNLYGQESYCMVWIFDHCAGHWEWQGDKDASKVFDRLQKCGKQFMIEKGEVDENFKVLKDDFYFWAGRSFEEIKDLLKKVAVKDIPLFIETIAPYVGSEVLENYIFENIGFN